MVVGGQRARGAVRGTFPGLISVGSRGRPFERSLPRHIGAPASPAAQHCQGSPAAVREQNPGGEEIQVAEGTGFELVTDSDRDSVGGGDMYTCMALGQPPEHAERPTEVSRIRPQLPYVRRR